MNVIARGRFRPSWFLEYPKSPMWSFLFLLPGINSAVRFITGHRLASLLLYSEEHLSKIPRHVSVSTICDRPGVLSSSFLMPSRTSSAG